MTKKSTAKPSEFLASQAFLEVKSASNGVLVLKDGAIRKIIAVSGMNFDLKSQEEQDIITAEYQRLLHSLDFSLQMITHSRRTNITPYLERLNQLGRDEENEKVKGLIGEYVVFLESLVKENTIVTKRFYVVVPYEHATVAAVTQAAHGFLEKILPKKKKAITPAPRTPEVSPGDIETLDERVKKVITGLATIGLQSTVLNEDETIELLHSLYNPEFVAPHEEAAREETQETL